MEPLLKASDSISAQQRLTQYELRDVHFDEILIIDRARKQFKRIEPLAYDIYQRGLTTPIALYEIPEDERTTEHPYLLLAGERRIRASKLAYESLARNDEEKTRLAHIESKIFKYPLTQEEIFITELHENILREDMTPEEELEAKLRIQEAGIAIYGPADTTPGGKGYSIRDTAAVFHETRQNTSRDLKMAQFLRDNPNVVEESGKKIKSKADIKRLMDEKIKQMAREELARRQEKKEAKTDTEKQQKRIISRYRVGDAFELVKKLPDKSIDFVELDPDWGIDFDKKEKSKGEGLAVEDYQAIPPEEYKETLHKICVVSHRVMRDHSWGVLWYSIEDWHEVSKEILSEYFTVAPMPGFWIHNSGHTATPAYRMGTCVQPFFYFRKGTPRLASLGHNDAFHFRGLKKNERTMEAEKPIEFYQEMIKTFCLPGSSALTLFAGSGNFLLAAANAGITAVGFDSSELNQKNFILKATAQEPGKYRSYL